MQVTEIEEQIERMRDNYELWQKQLGEYREKYQHLNYFTSEQLLYLRRELTKPSFEQKVIVLLQSVTPLPTIEVVHRALKHAHRTVNQETGSCNLEQAPGGIETPASTQEVFASEISDEHQKILDILIDDGYTKPLILKALQATESANYEDIRDWCMDNECDFIGENHNVNTAQVKETPEVEEVSESHPHVHELIDDSFTLQIALKAVRQSGGDIEKAREIALALESGTDQCINRNPDEEW